MHPNNLKVQPWRKSEKFAQESSQFYILEFLDQIFLGSIYKFQLLSLGHCFKPINSRRSNSFVRYACSRLCTRDSNRLHIAKEIALGTFFITNQKFNRESVFKP